MAAAPDRLVPERAYSPATVGRAVLAKLGITPLLERSTVPDSYLGFAMSAYFGGLAYVRIRRTPMPVRYVDFTSMYPTVFELLGLWRWLTAGELAMRDATAMARRLVASIGPDEMFDPATWRRLTGIFCLVQPDGELLPTRAAYGADPERGRTDLAGTPTIGLNPLFSDQPLWYPITDVLAAKLLGRRAPTILQAFQIVPRGRTRGLRKIELREGIWVDPRHQSLFRVAIEERNRLRYVRGPETEARERIGSFLKTLANACAYGIFAQMDVGEPTSGTDVGVAGLWSFSTRVTSVETPGPYCYPPLAASITGAGRLLLALLISEVERRGGTHLGADTDSLLIVASASGGLVPCRGGDARLPDGRTAVRALTDVQVLDIVTRFGELSPYARDAVPSLLKIEEENYDRDGRLVDLWGIGISAKRFVLYERLADGGYGIRKASEHGLGLYRPPVADGPRWKKRWRRWVELVWHRIIDEIEGHPVGGAPAWYRRPAVGQLTTSTWSLLAPFERHAGEVPAEARVRPFNFMLVGHVDPLAPLPAEFNGGHVTPVAPYSSRPDEFLQLPWVNRLDGRPLRVTTSRRPHADEARLRTYGEVVRDYRFHPEHKSADPEGGPCVRTSTGLLGRRAVHVTLIRHVGKESNRLDEVEEGLIGDLDEVQIQYVDERAEWEAALPKLKEIGVPELARLTGISQRTLRSNLNSGRVPHPAARTRLLRLATARLTEVSARSTEDEPA